MRFGTDHDDLSVWVSLDAEPRDMDLTDGLGDELLDLAVEGMLSAVLSGRAPGGGSWAPNSGPTKRAKGHGAVGYKTGAMLDPSNWIDGPRDVTPRSAVWTYAGPDYARHFHSGSPGTPARGLVGWTYSAESDARERVRAEAESYRTD